MANRSVQLYLYADIPGFGWRYCRAVIGAKNNLKPHVLLRPDGTEELHGDADYYLSYRNDGHKVWENVGNNPSGAMSALEKKRACLAYVATGGTVLANEEVVNGHCWRCVAKATRATAFRRLTDLYFRRRLPRCALFQCQHE